MMWGEVIKGMRSTCVHLITACARVSVALENTSAILLVMKYFNRSIDNKS